MIALALVQVKVAGTATTENTMTGTASLFPAFPSLESLIRSNVHYMSRHVLGMSYEAVQKIIYPKPRYKTFLIAKRNGSPRIIQEPRRALKDLQLKVLKFLEERSDKPKPCVHGFTRRRSIVTNARKHCSLQTHHLLNIDIKDFFPSIDFFRVRGVLRGKPFECSHTVATVLAHLCTYHNKLPQGAPTSPILANLVCRSMDRDLMDLARR
ncbi:MAG: reverse transcriptase family protein, partial [Oxalobacteraceae bacterium]